MVRTAGLLVVLLLILVSSSARVTGPATITASALPLFEQKVLVSAMQSPEDTWRELEENGADLADLALPSMFLRSLCAGIFVGFGGILASSVGFDMGKHPWEAGQGISRLVSGVVGFPLSILLVSITGNGAWTGDALLIAIAALKKRCSIKALMRFLVVTYLGCFCGTGLMAGLATMAALPCVNPCIAIAEHKLSMTLSQTFARGVGGGALICLSIFLSRCSRMMTGKLVSIVFTIGAYVACDFEHCLASMFFYSTSILNHGHSDILKMMKILVPSTIGNLVGGALFVGVFLSSIPKNKRQKKTLMSR